MDLNWTKSGVWGMVSTPEVETTYRKVLLGGYPHPNHEVRICQSVNSVLRLVYFVTSIHLTYLFHIIYLMNPVFFGKFFDRNLITLLLC